MFVVISSNLYMLDHILFPGGGEFIYNRAPPFPLWSSFSKII